jgi:SAM-dependent methyltransferase
MIDEANPDWAAARSDKWRRQLAGLEAMLAPITEPLIRALELTAPCRVADVGCGGGAMTLEVLHRAPCGSVGHGFDLSPALIEVARRRARASDPPIRFDVADMGKAAPPGGPYERLVSRLGVMFFGDPPAAFMNLRRWLVPGGRFAFAVWGPPADNEWMTATRDAVADVIDLAPVDSAGPGPFRYADAAPLLSLLERAGFVGVQVNDWRGALPIGGGLAAADAAQFALASFSSFGEQLSDAGGDAFHKAYRTLTARLARYERDGAVVMDARVHIISGRTERLGRPGFSVHQR